MNLNGNYVLPVPIERAYALLQDPVVLARCIPGCEALERAGENEYAMRMKLVISTVSGLFDGKVRLSEMNPPHSFRIGVDGTAKIGFVKGHGVLTLATEPGGTNVKFDGEVEVGGTFANVGQRVVETTARMLIKRFFDKLAMFTGLLATS